MALRETVNIIFNIIHDLANQPGGLSRREIVTKYKIGASTAHKYIRLIEDMGVPIYVQGQRYLLEESYFVNLQLTSEEGEFLFLALERALTSHTAQSRITRSLVNKLMHKLHPHLAAELHDRFRSGQDNSEGARIFTTLVQARRRRREVLVDYLPPNRKAPSRWRIRPYRFVSNPLSDGFYILCDGSRDGEAYISLSLKLDRIQDVQLTEETFDIADIARFQSDFGSTWGVWSSDGDPVSVVLRFEPRHYDRLLESAWHPSQSIHTDADGYVVYRVEVAAPQEMVPWIRSWGSGVMVEEPPELRQRLIRSVTRQARQYGLDLDTGADHQSLVHRLWAKREPKGKPKADTTAHHCLIYHLLDVAAVACRMWDDALSAAQKTWLQKLLGLDQQATRQQLALLAGLHDIGKATPAFQQKALDLYADLRAAGLHEKNPRDTPHGIVSAVILKRWLAEKGLSKTQASQLAAVIGGHHGDWITTTEMNQAASGNHKWRELQHDICSALESLLSVTEIALPHDAADFNAFAAFLSGFVSVCDWLGSNDNFFPFEADNVDPQAYFQNSLERARQAVNELGFIAWKADGREPAFDEAFRYLELEANALQRAAIEHLAGIERMPRLILVEYLTGGGKTELALHIADLLINRLGLTGSYIAMPTQATSNQMFERFAEYLKQRYPSDNINLRLVHGGADQQPHHQQMQARPQREGDESALTADWFQNRKRALLAPFGVGTIDQAMLSVMQAKHHFVRQYALSQKVIIFDEIHSYDTYMNAIIERLFNWLHNLNSPMILLSATLARQNRSELLTAVGASAQQMPVVRYPRLTIVQHDGSVKVHELPRPATRRVVIKRIAADENSLLNAILPQYSKGGCIAIVCNTVDESIALARLLRAAEGIDHDDVWLFHARFPPAWRSKIEQDVLNAFAKEAEARPERAILVATQIIEQSLDLDFDLMISRTAPIDLLIQRVGRLHRHDRAGRPAHLAEPTLLLREPEMDENALPLFGVDEVIYQRFFLLKTWLKLRDMTTLSTPDDIDALTDFVYSNDHEHTEFADALREARADMKLDDANSAYRGKQYVIGEPSDDEMIDSNTSKLNDEEGHVSTRDIRPGVDIICIINEELESRIKEVPGKHTVDELLGFKITVRSANVRDALDRLPEHDKWRRKPQLRYARVARFDDDRFDVPNSEYALRLTQDYGLEIIEKE